MGTPHLVADIAPGINPSTNPLSLTSVNGTAFFVGTSASQGQELWEFGPVFGTSFGETGDDALLQRLPGRAGL